MLLTKKVKAGVLLYALLMSAIFALLLQFYLGRVLATQRQSQAQLLSSQAQLMAQMTREMAEQVDGQLSFVQGSSSYHKQGEHLLVKVRLKHGQVYNYTFLFQRQAQTVNNQDPTSQASKPSDTGSQKNDDLLLESEN